MNFTEFFKRLLILIKLGGYSIAIYFASLGFSTGKNFSDSLISSLIFGIGIAGIVKAFTWLLEGFLKGHEQPISKKQSVKYSPNFYAAIYYFCLVAVFGAGYQIWKTYVTYGFDLPRILGGLLALFFFMYSADHLYNKWINK